MKKTTVLMAIFCLCFQALTVLAATPDFSGTWELDKNKSTIPQSVAIETMILRVMQTEKEITVQSVTKTNQSQTREGIKIRDGAQSVSYTLDGKETNTDMGSGTMAGKESRRATVTANDVLSLTITRNFNNEMGNVTYKTNETWELLDQGRTLKIMRYSETPRGATNAEMYFTKKGSSATTAHVDLGANTNPAGNNTGGMPKKISGGVLNGKATSLPAPAYPAAARAVKASGAVNVQVTIDEQGNVVSASAVSGHPLLRQAAEEAARNAKFAPTSLQGVPVTVTGVIVYNFVP